MEIAPQIGRLGTGIANSYLVEADGEITIVDAGVAGYWDDLLAELARMGRSIEDVRSVVLTHGHSDHIGFAERIRREHTVPIRVHELDAALARGEAGNPARGWGPVRPLPVLRFLVWGARMGALRIEPIAEVATFGDGARLDVPGGPEVISVPGHTPGSAAIRFPDHGALFVGDAFATYAVTTGREGPQIAPFTADATQARESLGRLSGIEARTILPGHGQPWTRGIDEAIRLVRATAG
jgi:glyoxylase-like metal-dependent hydrolase (beta-lactamase superfamily II)